MAIPDFIVYNNFISKYIPAQAKLETQKFKLRYFESKKLDQKLLDELAITLADDNLNLSTSDMAYFVYSNSKLIVEKQSHAKFIKLINEFKIPKGEEEKAFTKNFAILSIYAELKDKKKIEEYQSKLVIDPKVPDKIMDWALSLQKFLRHDFFGNTIMSQAFVKESEEQWLHEVQPTVSALIVYLTRENNGVRVYEKKTYMHPKEKREVIEMSNGLGYAKDDEGKWYVVW